MWSDKIVYIYTLYRTHRKYNIDTIMRKCILKQISNNGIVKSRFWFRLNIFLDQSKTHMYTYT